MPTPCRLARQVKEFRRLRAARELLHLPDKPATGSAQLPNFELLKQNYSLVLVLVLALVIELQSTTRTRTRSIIAPQESV